MLDDPARLREVDASGLMGTFSSLPEQLEEGLKGLRDAAWRPPSGRVFVLGMGGSAIAGDLASALAEHYGSLEIRVSRGPSLPAPIEADDLLVVISYSGNTWETLAAHRSALKRGLTSLTVSSGGELAEASSAKSIPHVPVPPGFPPRAALGYLLAPLLALLAQASPRFEEALPTALEDLSRIRRRWLPAVPLADNAAKAIARDVEGKVPIVYATPPHAGAARRWQTQLNENAKVLAWHSVLPEASHNEIVGWLEGEGADRFAPVVLMPKGDGRLRDALEATLALLRERLPVTVVRPAGDAFLTALLELVLLGDLVSVYLAALRGTDPRPIPSIDRLKEALRRRRGREASGSAEGEI